MLRNTLKNIVGMLRWRHLLILIAVALLALNAIAFYPGFYSSDSISQLMQAKSGQFNNWHPALMAIVWHWLIWITGYISSMFLLQVTMLWSAILLLCLYVYRKTSKRVLSLFPLLIGLNPFVFAISGVVWKDVQLAFSALLALAITVYSYDQKKRSYRMAAAGASLLLLIYACNVRHGVLLAFIPLFFVIGLSLKLHWKRNILFVLAVIVVTLGIGKIFDRIYHVQNSHVEAAVMVDDVIELSNPEIIKASDTKELTKNYLLGIYQQCPNRRNITNALFVCAKVDDFVALVGEDYNGLRSFWIETILDSPFHYAKFRIANYKNFIAPRDIYLIPEPVIQENNFDLSLPSQKINDETTIYIRYGYRDFGFGFKAYTWLIINILLIIYAVKRFKSLKHVNISILILLSGLIYVLLFAVSAISVDYRYYYWLVISTLIASVIIGTDKFMAKKPNNTLSK